MEPIKAEVAKRLADFVRDRYPAASASCGFLFPPGPELGDLAVALAFDLAKTAKKPPRQIAAELAAALEGTPGLRKAEVAGGGYVNLFLERQAYARFLLEEAHRPLPDAAGGKVIVEHTNINPNKAAHIGH